LFQQILRGLNSQQQNPLFNPAFVQLAFTQPDLFMMLYGSQMQNPQLMNASTGSTNNNSNQYIQAMEAALQQQQMQQMMQYLMGFGGGGNQNTNMPVLY